MKSYLIRAEKFFLPADCMDNGYLEVLDGKFGQWHELTNKDIATAIWQFLYPFRTDNLVPSFSNIVRH